MLIILLIFSSILFMKLLLNRMNRYIDENGKSSMGAVVEQIQQTYELQVNGYYSQLHLVEDYILKEKEVSPETDANQNFFEAWEKEAGSRLVFLQENGKAMTADGTKMRIDIPGKLLLALRNGHNIAKLVAWNYEETQSGGYLVAIPCQEYHMNGEVYTAVGTVYDHSKLDSMLKLKSYNENAYLFLLDEEENITYTNQSEDKFFRNYSLLKHLKVDKAITEKEAALLQKKMDKKEQGLELLGKDKPFYLGYCPIESNNSMLICIVKKSVVDNVMRNYQKTVLFTTILMGSFIILLFAGLFYSISKLNIADQKAECEKRNSELQLQTMKEMEAANKKLKKAKNIATEALQTAENANKAKTDFLSNMSHDIRTPMNAIIGITSLIRHDAGDKAKVTEYADKIDTSSQLLLGIINDVLDMSKIGSGKVHLEEIPVDLDEEMEKIHAIADVQAKKQEIRFSIEDEVVHRQFLGSPAHLRRILLNLISNALRYNKKGGKICLAIREVEYDGSHIGLEFKVQDTGIGMSREFVEKSLFKPFTQEDDRVRTEYRGTGLGMSIVYELVKQMNGTIDVNSKPGEGTTFTVKLAFKTVDPAWKKKEIQEENRNITGMNILAVEDNQLNMEILQFLLEEAGAKVTAVSDGKQAVEYFADAASGTYDVILMDIMMPVMDGLEASKKIRELPEGKGKDIPIIAMTANAFVEDKEKTKEAGMNAHLTKPVNREEIIRVLAAYWKNKG